MPKKPKQSLISRVAKYDNIDIHNSSYYKRDGWTNVLAGLGRKGTDKTRDTIFEDVDILDDKQLTALWIGDGLGKKIVQCIADDMIRNWISIPSDTDGLILKELDRLNVIKLLTEALYWTRLYKGSLIVLGINDGQTLDKPVNEKSIKGIDWIKVYPATTDIIPIQEMSFVKDPKSPYYGEVEIYDIYNRTQGIFIKVHTSRCLIFKGEAIPTTSSSLVTVEMEYWGLSVLNAIWTRLKNFGATEQGLANLMYEIVIGKYKLSNLAEILANNNTNAVYTRLEVINASKSLINAVLLGENEDYTRDTANLAGIPEMIDRIMMVLSGISGIPLTRLFGRSPAGLNATGESDLTTYYDTVSANQGLMLNKPLHKLINIVNSYLKVVNEEISFEFNPVREPSQKELLEMRKMQAEIDAIYLDRGVILPEEVARNRFGSNNQFQTQVDLEGERGSTEGMPDIE